MRTVLDTVILVRGLINPFSLWGRIVFDRTPRYRWLISDDIVAEYLDVLNRPELVRKYRTVENRDLPTIITQLATATLVVPATMPAVCRDPDDDKFLAAALEGAAGYIVSEDGDLLELGSYEGIPIVTAQSFEQALDEAKMT